MRPTTHLPHTTPAAGRTIELGSPGEAISKKDLHTINLRFKNLHHLRWRQFHEFLLPRQRMFLELLPLLFHINHPLLPGFNGTETPSGIPGYHPSRRCLEHAKGFGKSFSYVENRRRDHPILGLYLMGSAGSIAYASDSDIDVWLCHDPGLSAVERAALQGKARLLEQWAASLNLTVHFFSFDHERFRAGAAVPLSTESSGQTQHDLLLEEFYRTAIYLAGRTPIWWLVPPHEEARYSSYVQHLLDNRFVFADEVLDFGGLDRVMASEFISAALWHLYKSIQAPHKSLLKLLLMESYASEFPEPEWLASTIKRALYAGHCDNLAMDAYYLVYDKVDRYLQRQAEAERIALARQCFYWKIMDVARQRTDPRTRRLREATLRVIAERRAWSEDELRGLVAREDWDIERAYAEHNVIFRQLLQSHRVIMRCARQHAALPLDANPDAKLIERKLMAHLERKPGKIEIITTRALVRRRVDALYFRELVFANGASGWGLFIEGRATPLKKAWSLLELLAWFAVNDAAQSQPRIQVSATSRQCDGSELQAVLQALRRFLTTYTPSAEQSLTHLQRQNTLVAAWWIVNFGVPLPETHGEGKKLIALTGDALSYGNEQKTLVLAIEGVTVSTWGEIVTYHASGLAGVFTRLCEFVNGVSRELTPESVGVYCAVPVHGRSIADRVRAIILRLLELFAHSTPGAQRYVLRGGKQYYLFQRNAHGLGFWTVDSERELLQALAQPSEGFVATHCDSGVLAHTPLPFLYRLNRPEVVQVFCHEQNKTCEVYVLDERGALFHRSHPPAAVHQVLTGYAVFLEAVLQRYAEVLKAEIEFYTLQQEETEWRHARLLLEAPPLWEYLSLRVTAVAQAANQWEYTLYCDEKEFSPLQYGSDGVFAATAAFIEQFRRCKQHYPYHITDIDVPLTLLGVESAENLQTTHLLLLKQRIEKKLNYLN